jgi:hypothetical protein
MISWITSQQGCGSRTLFAVHHNRASGIVKGCVAPLHSRDLCYFLAAVQTSFRRRKAPHEFYNDRGGKLQCRMCSTKAEVLFQPLSIFHAPLV